MNAYVKVLSTLFLVTLIVDTNLAQTTKPVVTTDDYARAEGFLSASTSKLVSGIRMSPNWMDADRFWYRKSGPEGFQFVIVDPKKSDKEVDMAVL